MRLLFIALIIFILSVVDKILSFIYFKYEHLTYRNIQIKMQSDLGSSILKMQNNTLDKTSSGVFIQRLTSDVNILAEVFNSLSEYISGIITNVGVFIAIFILNKIMFFYILIMVIVLYLIDRKRVKVRKEKDKISRKSREKLSGFIGELVRGARDIKALNSENSFIYEMRLRAKDLGNKHFDMKNTDNAYNLLRGITRDSQDLIFIILIIVLIKKNIIDIPISLIIWQYISKVKYFSNSINYFNQYLKDFNLSTSRIKEILEGNSFPKEHFGKKHLDRINGDFEFKDVTFKYDKKDRKILDKISFKVNANETVAFVGKTGAGKTTIFNLLCKMYEPTSRKITIDGVDIKKLDKDSIRGNITVISQNPYIFNVSIRDNLKLVKEDVTEEEIKEALHLSCLDKLIEKLPEGIDTIVGEGGVNISGGERQRLAIARALVQKTEIILFDEATSSLDNETQSEIQKAIDNMKNEYTIMIIAHRLSTIINADRILFLNNGKIEAEGNHKGLLKTCKGYKELYESEIKNRK